MTRRCFSALLPATALAADAPRPVRTVMVGTGHGHAASKIKALQSMHEFELVGICRPEARPGNAANLPELPLGKVLADDSVELIAAESADPDRNLQIAEMAVEAGKFVHLDKPPGADLARLEKVLKLAASKRRIVQMGYQWRYHPAMQAAIEAGRKGWLGRVYRFRAAIDKLIGEEERTQLARYAGGMMFSEGCHLVDRATSLLGEPKSVTGFIKHHSPAADGLADNCLMVLDYAGARAELSLAGFDAHGGEHRVLEIQGTNGLARVQPYTSTKLHVELQDAAGPYRSGPQTIETETVKTVPYTPDFAELASVIRRGLTPSYSADHDLMTHRVLLTGCGML